MIKKVLANAALSSKFLVAIVLAAAVGGATTAVVAAAIPDGAGTIHSCYSKLTGSARIIDSPSRSCNLTENSLSWSQGGTGTGVANIISNSIDIAANDTATHQFIVLPGFGNVTVNCSNYPTLTYTNTSTDHILNGEDQYSPSLATGDSTNQIGSGSLYNSIEHPTRSFAFAALKATGDVANGCKVQAQITLTN